MLALVEKKAVKEHEISKRRKSAISECADTIRDLQKQSEQLKGVKLRLYEKYTSASITKAEYLKRKADKLQKKVVRTWLLEDGKRVDGRGINEIRPLAAEVGRRRQGCHRAQQAWRPPRRRLLHPFR